MINLSDDVESEEIYSYGACVKKEIKSLICVVSL